MDAMPKCERCTEPATWFWEQGAERYCDDHKHPRHTDELVEYQYAASLRAAIALLERT